VDEHDFQSKGLDEEECEADLKGSDIWEDVNCLELLQGGVLPATVDHLESKRARKRMINYHWQGQSLYFKGLLVPRPADRMGLVVQMHEDLGHSGEERILVEVCRRYFWRNRTQDVKAVVRVCQHCQMVKRTGSIRSEDEELKSIPVCDLFCRVTMDTARPVPETKLGNKYILVAIDHYSKWCEARAVVDHGAKTAAKFLEDDVICRYRVPKFVLTDNGGEWAAEFDAMCKDYGIHHQHTAPQWPQCNGMAERLIKTIKHGMTVLSAAPNNANCWDEQLAKVMFGYRCGIQSSTKFSPFMILTGRTPRLRADNYLHSLTAEVDDTADVEITTEQFMQKVRLIASIHENVMLNVERAQQKQKRAYVTRKGKHAFEDLVAGETMVKMKKPGKKKALTASWEGPYLFVAHIDGIGNLDFDEGS
jgi:transposase InsO family protein